MKTFEEVRDATADDLKAVIGYLAQAETNIRAGDIAALPTLMEKWSLWGQMLLIRLEARTEEYRSAQEATAPMSSPDRNKGA